MRQLKGKAVKENAKMKKERREAFKQGQKQVLTIALPVLLGIVFLIVLYVVMKTGQKKKEL